MKRNNDVWVYVAAIAAIVLLVLMYFLFVAPGAPFGAWRGDDMAFAIPVLYCFRSGLNSLVPTT